MNSGLNVDVKVTLLKVIHVSPRCPNIDSENNTPIIVNLNGNLTSIMCGKQTFLHIGYRID